MSKKIIKTPFFTLPSTIRSDLELKAEFVKILLAKVPLHIKIPSLAALAFALKEKVVYKEGEAPRVLNTSADYVPYVIDRLHKAGQIADEPNTEALSQALHPEETKSEEVINEAAN